MSKKFSGIATHNSALFHLTCCIESVWEFQMHLLLLLNSDVYATLLNSEVCPGRGQCTGSTWLEEDLGKSGNDANMAEHGRALFFIIYLFIITFFVLTLLLAHSKNQSGYMYIPRECFSVFP